MRNFLILLLIEGLALSCSESPRFRLLEARDTGISFNNQVVTSDTQNILTHEYLYNGAGVGIGDLNSDGLQDIVFSGNQVSPRVFLNNGNFRFTDITANFESLSAGQWGSGVVLTDINNDRLPDVFLTYAASNNGQKQKNKLFINQGTKEKGIPYFRELAEEFQISETGHTVHATFFDYDLDGDLDLYCLNNFYVSNDSLNAKIPSVYRMKISDGSAPNNDKLYRNNGNGTFSDITIESGIVHEGCGLGIAVGDINKDDYPDIYVSNDFIANDILYVNQKNGTFRNEIARYMSYQTKSSMGNDMADLNNDGNPEIYTMDMLPDNYSKRKQTINGFGYVYYLNDASYEYEHQYIRNMLHLHNGFIGDDMIPFSEIGQMAGIHETNWSWASLFADYDNDGDRDLIITNGYPVDLTDKDWTMYKMKAYKIFSSAQDIIDLAPVVKIPNDAYENAGNLKFVKQTEKWLPKNPSFSSGGAFADLDNDGDLDFIANNLNDQAFILRNRTVEQSGNRANYLRIKLSGKEGNTMAIGAKIELWIRDEYQFNENFLSRGYASSVDPVIHFGLGNDKTIDSLRVCWPASGYITTLINVKANQTLEIDEQYSVQPTGEDRDSGNPGLLFTKEDEVLNYFHSQTDFVDFYLNQVIIPHKFSQIGPVLAKGDINSDGSEDLIIGSTNKLPTTVMLRKGDKFEESLIQGLSARKEFSESDISVLDIEGDGDNDLIAVAGGYENKDEKDYKHYQYKNNKGNFERSELPVPPFPASVLRPFDFDHDGDIDLFIGSRVKKGMFPFANQSWMIINDEGKFVVEEWSGLDLGMVTDAVWSDYDSDGWEDLLIARDWNSLCVLKSLNGKLLIQQKLPELEDKYGIWYSLVAADFDLDGDDDYIAGNLGENHRFTVSDKYPMNLYAIDIDLDGIIDPLTTGFWKDKKGVMKEYPVNYLDELSAQSSFFRHNFDSYTSFSNASLEGILDENTAKRIEFKLHVNTTSSYILWNDNGKFRWVKLPVLLQVSPVKKMLARDLNNDNYPDVLVAGNDYTYDIATGLYDANKGYVLLSRGNSKRFDIIEPSRSGFFLQGMVESLVSFDGDTSIIVAGINRAKIQVFKQNPWIISPF